MPANTAPIFTKTPHVEWAVGMTSAITAKNLTGGTLGTDVYVIFTAGANGSYIEDAVVKVNPLNSTSNPNVARFWINNGSTIATAANSVFIGELSISNVAVQTQQATSEHRYQIRRAINAGYKLLLTFGATPGGSAEYSATAFGGDF